MINLIMQNTSNGNIHDISQLVTSITWDTVRVGKASELSFTLVIEKGLEISEGSIIYFKKDNIGIFYGYIFKIKRSSDETLSITAYDQIRYLLNKDTYVFKNKRADEIIKKIATDFNIKLGTIENTDYKIPLMVEDGQTLLDIIYKTLDNTLINTGKMYVLYDSFGSITLKNITSMFTDLIIGDSSLLTSYSYDRSIDGDSYNKIKLYKDNKQTGKREVFIVKDSSNIKKWGLLQYYEKVNDKLNEAQIRKRANQLQSVKNRVVKGLSLDCIGDLSIRAGNSIYVDIKGIDLKQRFIVDNAKHNFSNNQHTMSLTLKVI
ncbi:XkdQ/YqbQ family protein [Vallitalea maricola]|uniref:Uncharacterized protein n=1 Tax=Vallitalea maricola TaxID=3074433 RepID=A0ACB5UII1_9FIRM|nr:hypothetical protein AN2V17_15900 [Vallitalea sp. AN17-2]